MALSNNLTAILNFVALMCSIPIIAAGIWIASKPDNECIHWIRWPLVILGFALLLVSLAGFVGDYWKKEGLLAVYLVCMFFLIILLLVILVLAFVVTRPDDSYSVPGMGFREYRLDGFSSWLRNHITGNEYWGKIRACLAEQGQICTKLDQKFVSAADFFGQEKSIWGFRVFNFSIKGLFGFPNLLAYFGGTRIWSGCCKPPMICGYQYSGATTWVNPSNVGGSRDCVIWNNDQSQLCYNCDSCKAGLLGNLREEWRKANIVLIITVVVPIWAYIIACSAYKNAQTESLFRRYKRGWV